MNMRDLGRVMLEKAERKVYDNGKGGDFLAKAYDRKLFL
jgi:hypothetical protein